MKRLIITGANGAGKSHVAKMFGAVRPEIPSFSFDAVKLAQEWTKKPQHDIDSALTQIVASDAWILEGGPSLLLQALPKADAVVWLDPPELTRAWRLIARPWRNYGKTRPELPVGNVDWPLQQYRFAVHSLKNRSKFRDHISKCLDGVTTQHVWRCRHQKQIDEAVCRWGNSGP